MPSYDYDLFFIGAGSGGVAGSRRASLHGARVGICESSRVGGTCVIRGCVPKKLLVYGSSFADALQDAAGFGWHIDGARLDWGALVAAKNQELNRLEGVYRRMLRDGGVDLHEGHGRLVDAHTVEVDGQRHTASHIALASGGWPHLPQVPGIEHVITSNEALDLSELPRRAIIVGGGYIGCEFASIFAAAGVQVTQVVRSNTILRGFDEDVRTTLCDEMRNRGVRLRAECGVESIERTADGYSVRYDHEEVETTDLVMYATGRRPNTRDLGLEGLGIDLGSKGEVAVDEWSRTSVDSIHAIGDVTDRLALTPVAIVEGRALADTLFGGHARPVHHENVPHAVFSQPPLAAVGLTEAEAEAQGRTIRVYRSRFRPMKHTLSGRDTRAMMKLVVDDQTDRILGVHMVGEHAPEIVQGLAIAMTGGATKAQLDATVAIHPTAAEEFVLMRTPLER